MATNLTGIGTISYNGWTFAGPRVRSSLDVRPVRDEANRTVIYNIYTITVEAYITDDSTGRGGTGGDASGNIMAIRSALTKDGGPLIYSGLGHGAFAINTTANNRDVVFGPKTLLIQFVPTSFGAFEVKWTVEVAIAECGAGVLLGRLGQFLTMNYGVDYSIDRAGYTTRTISGHYQIALNRVAPGSPSIPQTADDYRNLVAPTVPVGFRRERQTWRISPDKSRMDFTIVDTEIQSDNAYPEGIVEMEIDHRVSSSRSIAFSTITNTITGFVEVAKPYPLGLAWDRCLLIIRERLIYARNIAQGAVLLDSVDITESLFSRRFSFAVHYRILGSSVGKILSETGIFRRTGSTDFRSWGNSLRSTSWHVRGLARLKLTPQQDRIVDPCNPNTGTERSDAIDNTRSTTSRGSLANQCPPRKYSYLVWKNWLSIEVEGTQEVNWDEMPKPEIPQDAEGADIADNVILSDGTTFFLPSRRLLDKLKQQELGERHIWLVLRGQAMRVCYPVQFPKLERIMARGRNSRIGNRTIDRPEMSITNSRTDQTIAGYVGGLKIYAARWELRYQIPLTANDLRDLIIDLETAVIKTQDDPLGEGPRGRQ